MQFSCYSFLFSLSCIVVTTINVFPEEGRGGSYVALQRHPNECCRITNWETVFLLEEEMY